VIVDGEFQVSNIFVLILMFISFVVDWWWFAVDSVVRLIEQYLKENNLMKTLIMLQVRVYFAFLHFVSLYWSFCVLLRFIYYIFIFGLCKYCVWFLTGCFFITVCDYVSFFSVIQLHTCGLYCVYLHLSVFVCVFWLCFAVLIFSIIEFSCTCISSTSSDTMLSFI